MTRTTGGWGVVVLLTAIYFVVGWLSSLSTPQADHIGMLPPSGIALALLLVCGYRALPVLFFGVLALNLFLGVAPLHAAMSAGITLAESSAACWLVKRFAKGPQFFQHPVGVRTFALAGVILGMLTGTMLQLAADIVFGGDHRHHWAGDWLARCTGMVVWTPVVLTWWAKPRWAWSTAATVEFAAMLGSLILVTTLVFGILDTGPVERYLLPYLCLPLLVWPAFRFTPRETATAVLCMGLVGLTGSVLGQGFVLDGAPSRAYLIYHEFMIVGALLALTIAAVVVQREEARQALETALDQTELQVRQRTFSLQEEVTRRARAEQELQALASELEQRVQERTAKLTRAIEALRSEIGQRRLAEAERLQALALLVDSQEDERARISRLLHDRLGQNLTALKLRLHVLLEQGPGSPKGRAHLPMLQATADEVLRHAQQLSWELHPSALDDFGLEPALQRFIREWFEGTEVAVDYHGVGMDGVRLPRRIEAALYRVAQEALTNILRHARAHRVGVLLENRMQHVSLIIEDDGQGFDVEALLHGPDARRRLGLQGIQERVTLVGGRFQVESSPGSGTTVIVRVPILGGVPTVNRPPGLTDFFSLPADGADEGSPGPQQVDLPFSTDHGDSAEPHNESSHEPPPLTPSLSPPTATARQRGESDGGRVAVRPGEGMSGGSRP